MDIIARNLTKNAVGTSNQAMIFVMDKFVSPGSGKRGWLVDIPTWLAAENSVPEANTRLLDSKNEQGMFNPIDKITKRLKPQSPADGKIKPDERKLRR